MVNLKQKGTYGKPAKSKVDIIKVYHTQHDIKFLTTCVSARLKSNTRLSRTRYGNVRFHEKGNLSRNKIHLKEDTAAWIYYVIGQFLECIKCV